MDRHILSVGSIFLAYILTVSVAVIPTKYKIAEEQSEGTFVADIRTDSGLNNRYPAEIASQLRFSFRQEGGIYDLFEINPNTGIIRTRQVIDRESLIPCHHTNVCDLHLSVSVKPLQFFEIIKIVVEVEDINDHIPTFPERRINWSITETTRPSARFVVPSAEDHDSGIFGIQKYNLTAHTTDKFKLQLTNHTDGSIEVALILMDSLDREEEQFYPMKITAWDGGDPEQSGSLLIDIMIADANDNNPKFSNASYEVSVYEDVQIDSSVAKVHASDPDSGLNGDVSYRLAPNTQQELGDLFAINNITGEITVKGQIDYEQETIYELQVMASDLGPHSLPAFCKVIIHVLDVNDHAPEITFNTFTDSGHAEVTENAEVGAFVAHVSVSDPDLGKSGNFDCELSSPLFTLQELSDSDNSAEFMIVTAATFDREQQDQYRVTLTCTDQGKTPMSASARIVVDIMDDNDHTPRFSQEIYKVSLPENNIPDASIARIRASDGDTGGNGAVRYSIQSLNPQDIVDQIVGIDAISGDITAKTTFDREQRSHYEFLVVASDHGISDSKSASTVLSLTIEDINDEYPEFDRVAYSLKVMENLPSNAVVGTVSATDADGSSYNKILYSIDNYLSHTDAFDIDVDSGEVITNRGLDREQQDTYTLVVFATNIGYPDISTRVNVTVTVLDDNDNDPKVLLAEGTLQLANDVKIGEVITRIKAEDADLGPNQMLHYSITNGNDDGIFAIDAETGAVTVASSLQSYKHKAIRLVIKVSDRGSSEPRATIVDLNIVVEPPASAQSGLLEGGNFVIFIGVVCGAIVIIVIIIIAILCTKFRSRRSKKGHRYNCQVEANKRLSNGSFPDSDICKERHSDHDLELAPSVECDIVKDKDLTVKKEVTFNMDREDFDHTPPDWPLYAHEAGLMHQPNVHPARRPDRDHPHRRRGPHRGERGERRGYPSHHHHLLDRGPRAAGLPFGDMELEEPLNNDHDSETGSYTDSGRGASEEGDHIFRGYDESRSASSPSDTSTDSLTASSATPTGGTSTFKSSASPVSNPQGAALPQTNTDRCFPLLTHAHNSYLWSTQPPPSVQSDYGFHGNYAGVHGCQSSYPGNQASYHVPNKASRPVKKEVRFAENCVNPAHPTTTDEDYASMFSDDETTTSGSYVLDQMEAHIDRNSSVV